MTHTQPPRWRRILSAPRLSPQGLLMRALLIAAAFLVVHLAGLRQYVGILTGTSASPATSTALAVTYAVLYVILYVLLVLLAPALLLGAGILFLALVLLDRHGPTTPR